MTLSSRASCWAASWLSGSKRSAAPRVVSARSQLIWVCPGGTGKPGNCGSSLANSKAQARPSSAVARWTPGKRASRAAISAPDRRWAVPAARVQPAASWSVRLACNAASPWASRPWAGEAW